VVSASGDADAVELPLDGEEEGEAADRPATSGLNSRKEKIESDKKHKKRSKGPRTHEGEMDLVSLNLTHASKAVRGELRGIKLEIEIEIEIVYNMCRQIGLTAVSRATLLCHS
jgi:hypothetical protein